MKAKHTNIQKSYVFANPMYIFSENRSTTPYASKMKYFKDDLAIPENESLNIYTPSNEKYLLQHKTNQEILSLQQKSAKKGT